MNKISFVPLMASLESEGASNIRSKFIKGRKHFIPKENMLANSLLDVVCSDKIMSVVNNEDFGMILDSLFPESCLEYRRINTYCDLLTHTLDCLKTQTKVISFCEVYSQELRQRIQSLKDKLIGAGGIQTDDVWQALIDIFKLATIIRNVYRGGSLSIFISRQEMDFLAKALHDNQVAINILQKMYVIRPEDRQLSILITWFLIEMICEQDDI